MFSVKYLYELPFYRCILTHFLVDRLFFVENSKVEQSRLFCDSSAGLVKTTLGREFIRWLVHSCDAFKDRTYEESAIRV